MATVINRTLEKLLGDLFDQSCDIDDVEVRERRRSEFVFHMTDWKDELQHLAELYEAPDSCDDQTAKDRINGVLYHALGHLIAAARLYDYVPDPFLEAERVEAVES